MADNWWENDKVASSVEVKAAADPVQQFKKTYGDAAKKAGDKLGVDPQLILGQWGEETGYGKKVIPGTNNLGNIKGAGVSARDNQLGTTDTYAKFDNPDAFADNYADLIQRKYPNAVGAGKDIDKFTSGLKGYAQDPQYASKIKGASNRVGEITADKWWEKDKKLEDSNNIKPVRNTAIQKDADESGKLYDPRNLLAGGEMLLNMGSSMVAKPVSEVMGLAATAKEAISPTPGGGDPRGFMNEMQRKMTYEPRTYLGQKFAQYNPVSLAGQGVNAVSGGVGGLVRGDAAPNSLRDRAASGVQEGINQGVGLLGAKVAAPSIDAIPRIMRTQSENLMQSALKPTLSELKNGSAATAIQTMLDDNIPLSKSGVMKIRERIDNLNESISNSIQKSTGSVGVSEVMPYIKEQLDKFKKQVNPESDIASVKQAWKEFKQNPIVTESNGRIPLPAAQELKQGTYQQLNKKYGEMGSASIEAQKAIARGLKEGIAKNAPEVVQFNREESRLIRTMPIVERRVLADANKNPNGLALLAKDPTSWAMFLADRSAQFKALMARVLNDSRSGVKSGVSMVAAPITVSPYTIQPQLSQDKK